MKLVLWCFNERRYFLCRFSLKSVEMTGLSVGRFLFGMVIWADCFVLLEQGFLGKMVGAEVLIDVVVEVVVEAVDVVQAGFFVFFWHGCLGYMVDVNGDRGCGWGGGVGWCGGGGLWSENVCRSWWCRKQRRGCGE